MKKIVLLSAVLALALYANEVKNLNDMTVTAQKTEESVQDVPIAMNVFSDVTLEDQKITDLKDVSYFVPNFYLLDAGDCGVFSTSMRGMFASPETASSTVGIYIDGFPTTNSVGFEAITDDIERIEVLRGPQGTLYGKNAEAGVINVVTKKPNNELEGRISLEYGEDNKQEVIATLRTPIIKDKLFVGITGRYYSKDGNIENTYLSESANDRKNYYGKIYLRATPTDRLELALIASKFKRDDGIVAQNQLKAQDFRKFQSDIHGFTKNSSDTYAFKLNYDFDSFDLSSTTSYVKYTDDRLGDYDYTPARVFHSKADIDIKTLSEELKLNGKFENLKWLFGIFGSKSKKTGGFIYISDVPTMAGKFYNDIDTTNLGVFTQLDYAFSDKLNLIGGIRYDRDKSEIDDPTYMYKDDFSSSNVSPKIALEYKWTKSFMTYATVSKGYKAGGFYMFADPNNSKKYDSESLWNYELGFKSTMLDNKLTLNADIYYMDISDMQVLTAVTTTTGYISNAASASSYGFELDANYAINQNFNIFGSFGYNQTKFDEFQDAFTNYKDNYAPFAPKYNYSLGGVFRGFGGVYASANITGYGKMYLDNANSFEQNSYTLVNAKIGYEWENFDIYLYADNLFDKNYDLVGYYGNYVMINPDREIGIKFTYRF